jgi:hypothetical protein
VRRNDESQAGSGGGAVTKERGECLLVSWLLVPCCLVLTTALKPP